MIGCSMLADADKRCSKAIFEAIYRDLYTCYRGELIPGSNNNCFIKTLFNEGGSIRKFASPLLLFATNLNK